MRHAGDLAAVQFALSNRDGRIPDAFGEDVDFAQLVKVYGDSSEGQKRYSRRCVRMSMRRFTRLTNGFSKKLDNHIHRVAIFYMRSNFGRVHATLNATLAMAASLSSHVWSIWEIVEMAQYQALRVAA